jgi:hypothetical protein
VSLSVLSRAFSRRTVFKGALLGAASAASVQRQGGFAQQASPASGATPASQSEQYLAVADPAAAMLWVYAVSTNELVAQLEDVSVNAHAGFIPLPDGQILFLDDLGKRLIGIEVHGDHLHTSEAPIPGTSYSHVAIDSDHAHYAAVGSDDPDSPITLVNLETWETTAVPVAEPGEVGLFLTHDHLFHRNNSLNQIEAYAMDSLLAGSVEILSTVPIGVGGHGESISMSGDTLYTATDEGIDVVAWDGSALTYLTTYAWDSADRSGGRGYFQRLSFDDSIVVSYTADRSAPATEWTTWTNDALLVDTDEGVTRRIELGTGYVYRFGLAADRALFYRIGGDSDEAIVLDLPSGTISQRIPLEPMSNGPAAGEDIYAVNQYRAVAMTTDGALGFVTQGGDGMVAVIDLATGTIASTIETGAALDGGGYLGLFGSSASFSDTIGR